MTEDYKKAQRLIREGNSNIQDNLIEVMVSLKKDNPNLTHNQVMDLFKSEVKKFLNFHDVDRVELPRKGHKLSGDKFPVMKIPYGGKNKI